MHDDDDDDDGQQMINHVCMRVQKRCCGIDGAWDYATSDWYNGKNPVDVSRQSLLHHISCI